MIWACVEEGWWTCFEKSIGVWSEGQEEAKKTKEDVFGSKTVGIEGNSGSDGKGEWSEMVQDKVRTTEDMEDASGEGEQECWFGEGGCLELSKMESWHWRDCC